MKKLMIAVALICAAAVSQAAKVDWSATNVADPWAGGEKTSPANGWLGYVILAADYSTVTADLANNDTASLVSKAVGPVKTTTSKGQFATGEASGSVAGGDQNFYLIILNNKAAADATYFYASALTPQTIDSSLDTVIQFGKQANTASASNWTAMAPEPTSGMLLLLGMGALALRRRRA